MSNYVYVLWIVTWVQWYIHRILLLTVMMVNRSGISQTFDINIIRFVWAHLYKIHPEFKISIASVSGPKKGMYVTKHHKQIWLFEKNTFKIVNIQNVYPDKTRTGCITHFPYHGYAMREVSMNSTSLYEAN